MSLKHKILAAGYYPFRFINVLLRKVGIHKQGRLRVLLYHDITPSDEESFATQLRWLSRSWRFITPDQFTLMIRGEELVTEDCLLLSFDDGFASNRRVAEHILNPMGIKSVFFVVSEFIALSDSSDWRNFAAQNIFPKIPPEEVIPHSRNMSWDDLTYLLDTGHVIGAHTANHARLSEIETDDLIDEIISSADVLAQKLGTQIEHFAYPFGDLASFSPEALAIARRRFGLIYTGLRGNNANGVPSWSIRRDSVTANDPHSLIGVLLEGGADKAYQANLTTYESWGYEK